MPSSRPSRDFKSSPQFIDECRRYGLRVRELREQAGLTLESASSAAELDLAHWQKIEAGKVNVTIGTMIRVANALDLALVDFFMRAKRTRR